MKSDSRVIFSTEVDESGVKNGLYRLKSSLGTFAKAAGIGIAAVASGMGWLAKQGLAYNSQMEQYLTSFTTLLGGNEQAAQDKITELKEFAANTPFEMTDLAEAQQTMLSFGIESDNASVAMKRLGDISMGNSEKFKGLALVYGQVASTGKLMGQDLLQMINQGFNPLTIIADKTGASMGDLKAVMSGDKTSKEFNKMVKDAQKEVKKLGENASPAAKMLAQIGKEGVISADMVDQAMAIATSEGGLYYGAMEKMSQTAQGQLSTLKDNANTLLGDVFSGLSESATTSIMPMAIGYVQKLSDAFKDKGTNGLIAAFGEILGDVTSNVADSAPGVVTMAVSLITSMVNGLKSNSAKIAAGIAGMFKSAVSGMATLFPTLFSAFLSIIMQLMGSLAEIAPEIIPEVIDAILDAFIELVENADQIIEIAVAMIDGISAGLVKAVPNLIEKGPTIMKGIALGLLHAATSIFESLGNGLIDIINTAFGTNIPHLDKIGFPSWESIKEFVRIWWEGGDGAGGVKASLSGALQWTLGLFSGGPQWEEIKSDIVAWWTGMGALLYATLNWALGKLGLPDWATLSEQFTTWWNGLGPSIESALNWTLGALGLPDWDTIKASVSAWWITTEPQLVSALDWVLKSFGFPDVATLVQNVKDWWASVKSNFNDIVTIALKIELPSAESWKEAFNTPQEQGIDGYSGLGNMLIQLFAPNDTDSGKIGADTIDGTVAGANKRASELTGADFADVPTGIESGVRTSLDSHSPAKSMYPVGEDVTAGIMAGMVNDTAKLTITTTAAQLKALIAGAFVDNDSESETGMGVLGEAITQKVADGIDDSSTIKKSLIDAVSTASAKAKTSASLKTYTIGGAMTSGIAKGITDHASQVTSALQKVIDDAIKAVKRTLGIASPSTVTRDMLGKNLADGIRVGFVGQMAIISKEMSNAVAASATAAKNALGNTLLGKVSSMGGISLSSGSISALATSGTTYGVSARSGSTIGAATYGDVQNTYNFYQPIQTPDETARAIRRQTTYGLAGARA